MPARASCCAVAAAIAFSLTPSADVLADSSALTIVPLDSFKTGGAEIGAHDPVTQRLFVTNAAASAISILSTRNPAHLVSVGTIDVSAFGSPNSVAVSRGLVAVAIGSSVKTDPGRVGF